MKRRLPAAPQGATAWPKAPIVSWDDYEDIDLPPPPPWQLQQLAHQVDGDEHAAVAATAAKTSCAMVAAAPPAASAAPATTHASPFAVSQPGERVQHTAFATTTQETQH